MSKITILLKSIYEISKKRFKQRRSLDRSSNIAVEKQLIVQLREKGVVTVEGFMTQEECTVIKSAMDQKIAEKLPKIWQDKAGAEHRIFGFDRIDNKAKKFLQNDFIRAVKESYYGNSVEELEEFVMANRITDHPDNIGSGGGWHRDSVHVQQLKAILYLTDVTEDTGAFEYLENTHHKSSVYRTILEDEIGFRQNRFTDGEANQIIEKYKDRYPKHTVTGKAGTLLLADTSGIHRGSPLRSGSRYAMTQYLFRRPSIGGQGIAPHIRKLLVE